MKEKKRKREKPFMGITTYLLSDFYSKMSAKDKIKYKRQIKIDLGLAK